MSKISTLIKRWRDRGKFYIAVNEPLSDGADKIFRPVKIEPKPQTLSKYLVKEWFKFDRATVNGVMIPSWEYYVPHDGDRIELFPCVATKLFSNAYIERLNAESSGGILLRSIILTEDPIGPVKKYFVDFDRELVVDGNTYVRLPMRWDGYEISSSMSLPQMKVSTFNLGQIVSDYVEEIDILGNEAIVQILHLDLLNDPTARDQITMQVQVVEGDDLFATFTLGMDLGLTDLLPRGVITKDEFPGVVDDVIRY
jgi:hypothetical protein